MQINQPRSIKILNYLPSQNEGSSMMQTYMQKRA